MIDPGWIAAIAIVAGNGIGWGVTHNQNARKNSFRDGAIMAKLDYLGERMDRLEKRLDNLTEKI